MAEFFKGTHKTPHPYEWLWEDLLCSEDALIRPLFGTKALYVRSKLCLCFSAQEEPWQGLLICTSKEHHLALTSEFPQLRPHSVLPKWLYLPEASDPFEETAQCLVRLVRSYDPRIGVMPKVRKPKAKRFEARKPKP